MSMTDIFRQSLSGVGFSQPYIDAALAISQGESGGNWQIRENPNYSPGRAREIFSAMRGLSDDQIRALSGNRERFFEAVYGPGTGPGRSLGNTQPGDGGRFYGRGMIQLTGRGNYERYARMTGHDIVNNPDLLISDPQVAMDVTAAYLSDRVDQRGDPVSDVRAAVAGGYDTAGYRMNIQNDRARFAQGGGEITFGSSAPELSGGGGLLSLSGESGGDNLQQEPARPSIWDNVPFLSDRDRRLRLAVAMQGLSTRPNQALVDLATQELGDRRDDERMNRTVAWLQSQPGGAQYAAALASGGVDAGSVITSYLQSQQPAEGTSGMRNYEFLISQGMAPAEAAERAFGGGVNIDMGGDGPQFGSIPAGHSLVENEDGAWVMEAIPGSPAWREQQEAAAEAAQADEQQAQANENTARTANVVLEDIGRARKLVQESPWYNPAVGTGTGITEGIRGSNAADAVALTDTIRANIGFDRLQQMREASPTGGALGQVTERELAQLQAVLGSLSTAQSREQFLENLNRLEGLYNGILEKASAYPNASEFGFGGEEDQPRAGTNAGNIDFSSMSVSEVDDLLRGGTLTPQQREAAIARIRQIAGN